MTVILVTGGAGFTGRHIVNELADAGHTVVSYNRDFLDAPRPDVTAVQGELADIPRLVRTLDDHAVEAIVHTAAISHPTYSLSFPVATFAANVEGTVALFEAARMAKVPRIVNFSSETVYGSNEAELIDEDEPVRPSTPYAVTKVATEWLGQVYAERFDVDVISLRIAQVYGPGNRMDEITRDIVHGVVRGGRFEIDHGGEHRYNLVYVRDVAAAARAAVEAPQSASTRPLAYNISSNEYFSLDEILDETRQAYPGSTLVAGPGLDPTLDLQGPFTSARAAADLGYVPAWPLARGIRDYGDWLVNHAN